MLDVRAVKDFGDFKLDIAFKSDARVTAIFGPSGAGKSSILKMVAGLLMPDQGRISVGDNVLFDSDARVDVMTEKRNLGFVFQDSRLFPHMSVGRNLTYSRWAGGRKNAIDFDHIVELLSLKHLLSRKPSNLSGGERQRVAIGRALLADPSILLLDEPMASLDATRREQLFPFIQKVGQEFDIPMLLVSHDLDEVSQLAENIVLLEGGKVSASGEFGQIVASSKFQDNIGVQQASTILEGEVIQFDPTFELNHVRLSGMSGEEGVIKFTGPQHKIGADIRLRVRARDVVLALEKPSGTSLQNCIFATVDEIVERSGGLVRVKCVSGQNTIYSYITKKSLNELKIVENMKIFTLIKAVSII